MAGPSVSDMQVEGPIMRELSNMRSEIKTSRVREVGEGGEEEAVVADVCQGLKIKFRAAWTLVGPFMGYGCNAAQCTVELKGGARTNTL